jgi:hypothetical protein
MKTSAVKVREAWMATNDLSFTEPSNEPPINELLDVLANWDVESEDDVLAVKCINWIDGVSSLHASYMNAKV